MEYSIILFYAINNYYFILNIIYIILFDWGLGIGDWGLGIGDWAQSPNILYYIKYYLNIK